MSNDDHGLAHLADGTVLLALQELTEDLSRTGNTGNRDTPLDANEAEELLTTLLREGDAPCPTDMETGPLNIDHDHIAVARRLLAHLAADPDTAGPARAVLTDPPIDERLSVETAIAGTVAIAALISWLQTKVEITIRRRNGTTDFEFRLSKAAAPPSLIRDLAATTAQLLGAPAKRDEIQAPERPPSP